MESQQQEIVVKGGKAYAFFKRCFDIVSSFVMIILLSWLFAVLALAVAFSSKAKWCFATNVLGKRQKHFCVQIPHNGCRCRKQHRQVPIPTAETAVGKGTQVGQRPTNNQSGQIFAENFPRRIAATFQHTFRHIERSGTSSDNGGGTGQLHPYQQEKLLSVKPGLTGYWQVYGRSNATYETGERQRQELAYLSKRGFFFDLKLIFLTIPAVLRRDGAK